jgi:hypothetical protein
MLGTVGGSRVAGRRECSQVRRIGQGLDRLVRRRKGRCKPTRSLRVSLDLRSSLAPPPNPIIGLGRTAAGPLPSGLGEVPVVAVLRPATGFESMSAG